MTPTAALVDAPSTTGGVSPAAVGAAATPAVREAIAGLAAHHEALHRHWAARLGVRVDAVEVSVETAAEEGAVTFEVTLRGPEASARYDEVRAAVESHAPVIDLTTGR